MKVRWVLQSAKLLQSVTAQCVTGQTCCLFVEAAQFTEWLSSSVVLPVASYIALTVVLHLKVQVWRNKANQSRLAGNLLSRRTQPIMLHLNVLLDRSWLLLVSPSPFESCEISSQGWLVNGSMFVQQALGEFWLRDYSQASHCTPSLTRILFFVFTLHYTFLFPLVHYSSRKSCHVQDFVCLFA